jgi:acyl-CoA thioesterase-1
MLFVCALAVAAPLGAAETPTAKPAAMRTLVFFGDSLTAGFGLDEPGAESFPALIQKKIETARLPWRVVNAGLSGETSSGGVRRVDWVLRQPVDIFVLALGGNDGLRGIEPAVTRANLGRIIARIREKNPAVTVLLAGMQMPPNLGPDYTRDFADLFPALAKEARVTLVPFLLEGVGGRTDLNQPDGIHPTAEGHRVIAENLWARLLPLL